MTSATRVGIPIDCGDLLWRQGSNGEAEPFYSSPVWIALRDRVRREAGGRCQVPGCGRIERGMIVDHIVELKDGGVPLDRSNARLMCRSHHNQKTDTERARRTARRPGGP